MDTSLALCIMHYDKLIQNCRVVSMQGYVVSGTIHLGDQGSHKTRTGTNRLGMSRNPTIFSVGVLAFRGKNVYGPVLSDSDEESKAPRTKEDTEVTRKKTQETKIENAKNKLLALFVGNVDQQCFSAARSIVMPPRIPVCQWHKQLYSGVNVVFMENRNV